MTSVLLLGSSHINRWRLLSLKSLVREPLLFGVPKNSCSLPWHIWGKINKLHHVREMEDHARLIQPTRIYMQEMTLTLLISLINRHHLLWKELFLCVGGF